MLSTEIMIIMIIYFYKVLLSLSLSISITHSLFVNYNFLTLRICIMYMPADHVLDIDCDLANSNLTHVNSPTFIYIYGKNMKCCKASSMYDVQNSGVEVFDTLNTIIIIVTSWRHLWTIPKGKQAFTIALDKNTKKNVNYCQVLKK